LRLCRRLRPGGLRRGGRRSLTLRLRRGRRRSLTLRLRCCWRRSLPLRLCLRRGLLRRSGSALRRLRGTLRLARIALSFTWRRRSLRQAHLAPVVSRRDRCGQNEAGQHRPGQQVMTNLPHGSSDAGAFGSGRRIAAEKIAPE
jgi:hypothetical protein